MRSWLTAAQKKTLRDERGRVPADMRSAFDGDLACMKRLMIDTFHMNIEEKDMLSPLPPIRDILVHVHLCETNRDVLGAGHWDTAPFLRKLREIGYAGYCSIGVYNTRLPRRECIARCFEAVQASSPTRASWSR